MISLSLHDIAEAVGGRLIGGDLQVTGSVETDSRLVQKGSLFVCKPGEETDGHLFAQAALDAGAVALIVERELDVDAPQVLVACLLYTSPSPRDYAASRMPSSA